MNREQLDEMDQDQLIAYAKNKLNLDVDRRFGEEKLKTLILAKSSDASNKHVHQTEKFSGFPNEDGEFVVPPGAAVVEIQTNHANPYKRPVPLGVNGKFIAAPVERPICIDKKYLEVLRNAVREETIQKRENGQRVTHYNTRASYPFSILYENRTDKVQKVNV